jgi:hypothetical protein
MTTPSLEGAELLVLNGREIPVLPLSAIGEVLKVSGRQERAAMVQEAIAHDRARQMGG